MAVLEKGLLTRKSHTNIFSVLLISLLSLLIIISYSSALEICPADKTPTKITISHARHPANPIVGKYQNTIEIVAKLEWQNPDTGERGVLPGRRLAFEISLFQNFSKEQCGAGAEGCDVYVMKNNSEDAIFFRNTSADGTTHLLINLDTFFGQPTDPNKISYTINAVYSPNNSVAADKPYMGSSATATYTPSSMPAISIAACFPLILILGLLMGAMYVSGKNPFGYLDFSRVAFRMPRQHRRAMKSVALATPKPVSKLVGKGMEAAKKGGAWLRSQAGAGIGAMGGNWIKSQMSGVVMPAVKSALASKTAKEIYTLGGKHWAVPVANWVAKGTVNLAKGAVGLFKSKPKATAGVSGVTTPGTGKGRVNVSTTVAGTTVGGNVVTQAPPPKKGFWAGVWGVTKTGAGYAWAGTKWAGGYAWIGAKWIGVGAKWVGEKGYKWILKYGIWDTITLKNSHRLNDLFTKYVYGTALDINADMQIDSVKKSFEDALKHAYDNGLITKEDYNRLLTTSKNSGSGVEGLSKLSNAFSELKGIVGSAETKKVLEDLVKSGKITIAQADIIKKGGDDAKKLLDDLLKNGTVSKTEHSTLNGQGEETNNLDRTFVRPFYTADVVIMNRIRAMNELASIGSDTMKDNFWNSFLDLGGGGRLQSISSQTITRTGVHVPKPELKESYTEEDVKEWLAKGWITNAQAERIMKFRNQDREKAMNKEYNSAYKTFEKALKLAVEGKYITREAADSLLSLLKDGKSARDALMGITNKNVLSQAEITILSKGGKSAEKLLGDLVKSGKITKNEADAVSKGGFKALSDIADKKVSLTEDEKKILFNGGDKAKTLLDQLEKNGKVTAAEKETISKLGTTLDSLAKSKLITEEEKSSLYGFAIRGTNSTNMGIMNTFMGNLTARATRQGDSEDIIDMNEMSRKIGSKTVRVGMLEIVVARGKDMEKEYEVLAKFDDTLKQYNRTEAKIKDAVKGVEKTQGELDAINNILLPYARRNQGEGYQLTPEKLESMQKEAVRLGYIKEGEKLDEKKILDIAIKIEVAVPKGKITPTGEVKTLPGFNLPSSSYLNSAIRDKEADLRDAQEIKNSKLEKLEKEGIVQIDKDTGKINRLVYFDPATGNTDENYANKNAKYDKKIEKLEKVIKDKEAIPLLDLVAKYVAKPAKDREITESMQDEAVKLGIIKTGEKLIEDKLEDFVGKYGLGTNITNAKGESIGFRLPTADAVNSTISLINENVTNASDRLKQVQLGQQIYQSSRFALTSNELLIDSFINAAQASVNLEKHYMEGMSEMVSAFGKPIANEIKEANATKLIAKADKENKLDFDGIKAALAKMQTEIATVEEKIKKDTKEKNAIEPADIARIKELQEKAEKIVSDKITNSTWSSADDRNSPTNISAANKLAAQIVSQAFESSTDSVDKGFVTGKIAFNVASFEGTYVGGGDIDANRRNLEYNTSSNNAKKIDDTILTKSVDKLTDQINKQIGVSSQGGTAYAIQEDYSVTLNPHQKLYSEHQNNLNITGKGFEIFGEKKNEAFIAALEHLAGDNPILKGFAQQEQKKIQDEDKRNTASSFQSNLKDAQEQMKEIDKKLNEELKAEKFLVNGDFKETTATVYSLMLGKGTYSDYTPNNETKEYVKEIKEGDEIKGYTITFKESDDINARLRGIVASLDKSTVGNHVIFDAGEITHISIPEYGIEISKSGNELKVEKKAPEAPAPTPAEPPLTPRVAKEVKGVEDLSVYPTGGTNPVETKTTTEMPVETQPPPQPTTKDYSQKIDDLLASSGGMKREDLEKSIDKLLGEAGEAKASGNLSEKDFNTVYKEAYNKVEKIYKSEEKQEKTEVAKKEEKLPPATKPAEATQEVITAYPTGGTGAVVTKEQQKVIEVPAERPAEKSFYDLTPTEAVKSVWKGVREKARDYQEEAKMLSAQTKDPEEKKIYDALANEMERRIQSSYTQEQKDLKKAEKTEGSEEYKKSQKAIDFIKNQDNIIKEYMVDLEKKVPLYIRTYTEDQNYTLELGKKDPIEGERAFQDRQKIFNLAKTDPTKAETEYKGWVKKYKKEGKPEI